MLALGKNGMPVTVPTPATAGAGTVAGVLVRVRESFFDTDSCRGAHRNPGETLLVSRKIARRWAAKGWARRA